jgi:chromate transporter
VNAGALFFLMLKASLFSFSGTGNLPILRSDLLPLGWATDKQFVEALAVGQVSPGPMGLWVISLGYLMDGWIGATLALIAICIPPLLVVPLARLYRRVRDHAAVEGFMRGLSLAVVGIFAVILATIQMAAGIDLRALAIVAAAFGLALSRRVPLLAILAVAALVGWISA